jgi:hypothetical protein
MGNDGLAASGITHRHPPAARLCRGGVSFGTLESRPPVGTPRRQPGETDRRQFVERFPPTLLAGLDDEERFAGACILEGE